jgi:putative endonuclease
MIKGGAVYIVTNATHTTLYTGVTSDLKNRVWKHKTNFYPGSFSSRYKLYKLVYYCTYSSIMDAILVEKKIKSGSRRKKMELIENINPEWRDLYEEL